MKSVKTFYKAVSTNTREFKTGLLLTIDTSTYLFNVPDDFSRLIFINKGSNLFTSKGMAKYAFLSSLDVNHFGGFPSFYLS